MEITGNRRRFPAGYFNSSTETVFTTNIIAQSSLSVAGSASITGNVSAADASFGRLLLNQGSSITSIISMASTDVAHGMTSLDSTDVFSATRRLNSSLGGVLIAGYTEANRAVQINARVTTDEVTKSSTALAPFGIVVQKKSGTTVGDVGDSANLFYVANNGKTVFIIDEDGDIWTPGKLTHSSGIELLPTVTVFKAGAQSLTDSTLVNDTHLQIALDSVSLYAVEMFAYITQTGSSGDPVVHWTAPTSATLLGAWHSGITGSDSFTVTTLASSAALHTGSSGTVAATFRGVVETQSVAGTLIPQWRQQDADASATTVAAFSWMSVTKIGENPT